MTPLPSLSRKFAERTGQPAPGYNRCRRAILDGVIPAQKIGREWFVADADLPAAEEALGLVPAAPAQPSKVCAPRAATASVAA